MEDPLSFHNSRNYGLYLSIDSSYQPDEDAYAEYLLAYAERLRGTADMLLKEDWYTLTKEKAELKSIISTIKDVIHILSSIGEDPKVVENGQYLKRVDIDQILENLYAILTGLHTAGERAGEVDFAIRVEKYNEFGRCHRNLVLVAKQLTI